MMKKALAAIALSGMAMSAHASLVITENFDNVGNLVAKGWTGVSTTSVGSPNGWYQGDPTILTSQAGLPNSYAAISYQVADYAPASAKLLDNWLLSPVFDATGGATVSFWLLGEDAPGYSDRVKAGFFLNGAFVSLTAIASPSSRTIDVPTNQWTQYTVSLNASTVGMARFGVQYVSAVAAADYVGLDSVVINSVPEPASLALLAFGALGLGIARRRRA